MVEVMITLLITSLMMVAILEVLSGARRTRDVIHNARESQLAGPAILDLIEADLRGLFVENRLMIDILRVEDNAISGLDADRLDFVTSANNRMLTPNADRTRYLRADICEVGYCVRTNLDYEGEFLEIWRRESFGVDEEPFRDGKFTFLHDRVRRFDIQVFNEDGPDGEPLESWGIANADEEFRGLPTRIEIELELEPGARLLNESSTRTRKEKRRVLYRRIIHFPQRLHLAMQVRPVPRIPKITPPAADQGRASTSTDELPGGSTGGGVDSGTAPPPFDPSSVGAGGDAGASGTIPPFGGLGDG
jgi:hypothetical protein